MTADLDCVRAPVQLDNFTSIGDNQHCACDSCTMIVFREVTVRGPSGGDAHGFRTDNMQDATAYLQEQHIMVASENVEQLDSPRHLVTRILLGAPGVYDLSGTAGMELDFDLHVTGSVPDVMVLLDSKTSWTLAVGNKVSYVFLSAIRSVR